MDILTAVTQLSSIAQEARLTIFKQLVQAGPDGMPAGMLSECLQIPPSTLSFHLKELSHAGLIHARQISRYVYYSADFSAMEALITYLTENCCAGAQDCLINPLCNPNPTGASS
jgi:DNA-binding transcriptional ArsR family regulator